MLSIKLAKSNKELSSKLSKEQQRIVRKILLDEARAYSLSDEDMGCNESIQIN